MISVTNMEHEMYNDGLYFNEQATNETFDGDKQRCYRFAVISFASSFESFINRRLKGELEKDKTKISNGQDILDFLNEGFNSSSRIPTELKSITKKLKSLEVLLGLSLDTLNTSEFEVFDKEVIKLRNSIVHYSHSSFTDVYESDLKKAAQDGAELLVKAVQSICAVSSLEFPPFYSNKEYKSIEY